MADDGFGSGGNKGQSAALSKLWEDEDAGVNDDDEDVLDDWDAEPEENTPKPVPVKPKALSKAKLKAKIAEEERKARRDLADMSLEERMDAKAEQQRMVEEADHQLTSDLFGGINDDDNMGGGGDDTYQHQGVDVGDGFGGNAVSKGEPIAPENSSSLPESSSSPVGRKKLGDTKDSISGYTLNTENDFTQFSKDLVAKLKKVPMAKHKFVTQVLKTLIQETTESLTLDETTELKSAMTVLHTNKQKAQRNKKKKGKFTKSVKVSHNDMEDMSKYNDDYDDFF